MFPETRCHDLQVMTPSCPDAARIAPTRYWLETDRWKPSLDYGFMYWRPNVASLYSATHVTSWRSNMMDQSYRNPVWLRSPPTGLASFSCV